MKRLKSGEKILILDGIRDLAWASSGVSLYTLYCDGVWNLISAVSLFWKL